MKVIISVLLVTLLSMFGNDIDYVFSDDSKIVISGNSTLHKWTCDTSTIRGNFTLNDATTEFEVLDVDVDVDVLAIECSKGGKMNKLMRGALKAKTFDTIEFNFKAPPDTPVNSKIMGNVTIAGVTQPRVVNIDKITSTGDSYIVEGHAELKMTDFNVKPPKALLGTIKTHNDITVSFNITGKPKP